MKIVHEQPNDTYNVGNENFYNTEVLKSNLCDYNDYILVRGDMSIIGDNGDQKAFKNYMPFS